MSRAEEEYDRIGDWFSAIIEQKPHNAYFERPATLSLLPDVMGKRVLDAGCGPGVYAKMLLDMGASVVAIDVSQAMVTATRARTGGLAEVLKCDLEHPLEQFADGAFDCILAAWVLECVRDWRPLFREFHRLLRPNGVLVFSVNHPFAEWKDSGAGAYFEVEEIVETWHLPDGPVVMHSYRRPLSMMLEPLLSAGFCIDKVIEPVPTKEFASSNPEQYLELIKEPGLLCVRAVKDIVGR